MRDLQWRWMTASSMKEVVKIDANKRQAMRRRISVDSIIYNCMESLSEQSGAERRHFVKCKLVRPEVLSKKKKKNLGAVVGKSAWKSVMNVGSAAQREN
jgi:hypothetical protein